MIAPARYREYLPCAALQPYVRALFSFSVGFDEDTVQPRAGVLREVVFGERDPFWSTLFADAHASVVANIGDDYRIDGIWEPKRARAHWIGPMSGFRASHYGERLVQVGAYLKPGRARALMGTTGAPASELADCVVALEDLWGPAGAEFEDRFHGAPNQNLRVAALEAALLRRVNAARPTRDSVDITGIAQEILSRQGQAKIEDLAETAGVSRQHLTRLFQASVGVGPKMYARLARFQCALRTAANGANWAETAIGLGYADQSHFIAEFRQFSGLTPERFVSERMFHPFQGREERA